VFFEKRNESTKNLIDVLPSLAQALDVSERKRTAILQVRLTDEEKARLELIVDATGLNASDWIRQAIRQAAEKLNK
jgi:hypothetical protein